MRAEKVFVSLVRSMGTDLALGDNTMPVKIIDSFT